MDGTLTGGAPPPGHLWRGYRGSLAWGVLCLLGLAATTAAYAYLSGPVVSLLLTGAGHGPRPLLQQLPGMAGTVSGGGHRLLWAIAGLLVGLALLKGLCQLGASLLLEGTAERIGADLRQRIYEHLLKLPLAAHRRHSAGDLIARLLDDVRRLQEAELGAPLILWREGLAALALALVAIGVAPGLALAALLVLPLAGLVIGALGRAVKRAAAGAQAQLGELSSRATQGLAAIREVKSCGAEQREVWRLAEHARRALRFTLQHLRARALAPLANETMAAAALGAVLVYAGDRVARGLLAPERFLSFFTALLLLYRPLKEIGRAAHLRAAGRASRERIEALLALPPEPRPAPGTALRPLQRAFQLERVSFSYTGEPGCGAGQAVLSDLSLELPVGRVVAVTGASGVGKSTLANLVCGLEPPSAGRLLWDGEEVGTSPERLRAAVALVPQQPLLFDGSVAENLRYGAPSATDAELRQALQAAALADRVERMAAGLRTRLGAGGIQLSVGEAQRLALARALLRQSSLIVLDEPTTALDQQNQRHLCATLVRVAPGRAVLLVAHSPELLSVADQVWELRDGRLVLGSR